MRRGRPIDWMAMDTEIVLALVASVLAMFGLGWWAGTKTRSRRVSD